jgi:1,4-dihydroxy-2-naphthoyl-CoA hydrolase
MSRGLQQVSRTLLSEAQPMAETSLLQKVKDFNIPFARVLGIDFVSADADKVVATMLVRDDLCTARNNVHGGALMAFADTIGACATVINLPPDASGTTTLESKTNFLRPAAKGVRLTATATPIHVGRRTHVWQTRIEDEERKLVAVVTQTQIVL